MNKSKLSVGLIILISLMGIIGIIFLSSYNYINKTNHTSVDPYIALLIFIPVTLIGLIEFLINLKKKSTRWLAIVSILIGLAGILLLIYLDKSNTLLQYEVWIKRGMP